MVPLNSLTDAERADLVAGVEGLCRKLAYIACRRWPAAGDEDDFFQEARRGAMRAAERFRPELRWQFTTYATWWIRNFLYRFGGHSFIHIPEHLRRDGQLPPQVGAIADDKLMIDPRAADPADIAAEREASERYAETASQLLDLVANRRDRQILRMRYGIGYREGWTLEEIAGAVGLTKERVRQILEESIRRIRKIVAARSVRASALPASARYRSLATPSSFSDPPVTLILQDEVKWRRLAEKQKAQ